MLTPGSASAAAVAVRAMSGAGGPDRTTVQFAGHCEFSHREGAAPAVFGRDHRCDPRRSDQTRGTESSLNIRRAARAAVKVGPVACALCNGARSKVKSPLGATMMVATVLGAVVATAGPPNARAAPAPPGQGFTLNAGDLKFILKQIKIAENARHARRARRRCRLPAQPLFGTGANQIAEPAAPVRPAHGRRHLQQRRARTEPRSAPRTSRSRVTRRRPSATRRTRRARDRARRPARARRPTPRRRATSSTRSRA